MFAPNVRDENGDSYIPASQRPDGTWRKARRVKDGYVPQEEVPLYESKGKQLMNKTLKPADPRSVPVGYTVHKSIPGLFIQEEKDKPKNKKKSKKVDDLTQKVDNVKLTSDEPKPVQPDTNKPVKQQDNKKTSSLSSSKPQATNDTKNKPFSAANKAKDSASNSCSSSETQSSDPAKKLKNLKKRLREVEALELKVQSGEITHPDPDQVKKLHRKVELLMQIRELEK